MEKNIKELVEVASTKAKKVVVSSIVRREDNDRYDKKGELVNASVRYNYMNNDNVFICNNRNDPKFRWRDGIHLTDHGTSVLANNLKFIVAKALNIRVEKRIKDRHYNRTSRYGDRQGDSGNVT